MGLDAIVSSIDGILFTLVFGLSPAGIANGFDAANSENGTSTARDGCPSNRYLVTHMFGEAFSFKAFGLQVGDRVARPIVDQYILACLFINTTGHGCRAVLSRRLL